MFKEDIKNSKFLKFTFALNMVYFSYKSKGFIEGTKTIIYMSFISINKWLFNHRKLYERFLRKRVRKKYPEMEVVLDIFLSDKPFDFKGYINSNPKFKEDFINNFDKYKETAVNSISKNNSMTEEEIEELRNSIKLENYVD